LPDDPSGRIRFDDRQDNVWLRVFSLSFLCGVDEKYFYLHAMRLARRGGRRDFCMLLQILKIHI
jgi:hypothetical protein